MWARDGSRASVGHPVTWYRTSLPCSSGPAPAPRRHTRGFSPGLLHNRPSRVCISSTMMFLSPFNSPCLLRHVMSPPSPRPTAHGPQAPGRGRGCCPGRRPVRRQPVHLVPPAQVRHGGPHHVRRQPHAGPRGHGGGAGGGRRGARARCVGGLAGISCAACGALVWVVKGYR